MTIKHPDTAPLPKEELDAIRERVEEGDTSYDPYWASVLSDRAALLAEVDRLKKTLCTCHTYMTEGGPVTSGVFQCPAHQDQALDNLSKRWKTYKQEEPQ